jgi:hypothetical protein
LGYQIKENEMGGVFVTKGIKEKYMQALEWENRRKDAT